MNKKYDKNNKQQNEKKTKKRTEKEDEKKTEKNGKKTFKKRFLKIRINGENEAICVFLSGIRGKMEDKMAISFRFSRYRLL